MNLSNIIKAVSQMLSLSELNNYPTIESTALATNLKNLMIFCVNETISDLTFNYFPIVLEQTLEVGEDNTIAFSALEKTPTRIYAVLDENNNSQVFHLLNACIKLSTPLKKATVRYGVAPPTLTDETTEITGVNVGLTEYMVALGTAREFCLNRGKYNQASVYEQKYKDAIENAKLPKRCLHLKPRAWLA